MREYHENILKYLDNGWRKHRESAPYYIFLRNDAQEELKIALRTGKIVRGPYNIPPPSHKK